MLGWAGLGWDSMLGIDYWYGIPNVLQKPVADAADACGYQSIAAFTHALNKVVGTLPGAYRKQFD